MLYCSYPCLSSDELRIKKNYDVTVLHEYTKEGIKLICADGYKKRCYPLLAGLMVDFKEQVFITDIKVNMQFSICYV